MKCYLSIFIFSFFLSTIVDRTICQVLSNKTNNLLIRWNLPIKECSQYNLFQNIYQTLNNYSNRKPEDEIIFLREPGYFPISNLERGIVQNSGFPQSGNLPLHLQYFNKLVDDLIELDTTGMIGIVFNEYTPLYSRLKAFSSYTKISYMQQKRLKTNRTKSQVSINEKQHNFDVKTREYFEQTLKSAHVLRPKAKWGFTDYPFCFEDYIDWSLNHTEFPCDFKNIEDNDRLLWMYNVSGVFMPRLPVRAYFSDNQNAALVSTIFNETSRLMKKLGNDTRIKVVPILSFAARGDEENYPNENQIINILQELVKNKADGLIIWDYESQSFVSKPGSLKNSDNDDDNEELKKLCDIMYTYVNNTLNPAVQKFKSLT